MYFKLEDNIALRKWKYVDRAIYARGNENAFGVSKEDFEVLLKCDGKHDLEKNEQIERLLERH